MKLRRYTVYIIDISTNDPAHVHKRCFTKSGAVRARDNLQSTLARDFGSYTDHLKVYAL